MAKKVSYRYRNPIKATQWFKMGDHPLVYVGHVDEKGKEYYKLEDGIRAIWNQSDVHPGNYIVEFYNDNGKYKVKYMGKRHFEKTFVRLHAKKGGK